MFRPLRSILSLALLLGALWAAFAVDLGGRSFAEHVDTISATPEAEELIEGTRSAINPALAEVRDRLLGEYVEAPTWIPTDAAAGHGTPDHATPDHATPDEDRSTLVSTLTSGRAPGDAPHGQAQAAGHEPALPGRRRASRPEPESAPESDPAGMEPALPGRRR